MIFDHLKINKTIRSAVLITFFALSAQFIGFLTQVLIAKLFGASKILDVYLAAITLPQYVQTTLMGSLVSVLIPIYIDVKEKETEYKLNEFISSVTNLLLIILSIITLIGIIFSKELLSLSTPGLNNNDLEIGANIAKILWLTVFTSGFIGYLSAIYQAEHKFNWQAIVPFIGSVLNLITVYYLADNLKGIGLAIAVLFSSIVQVVFLLGIIKGKYIFLINFKTGRLAQIINLLMPLFFIALITKFTPILDRALGSGLSEGTISHLNYANKLLGIVSLAISTGISVIIFPKMSLDVSSNNLNQLKKTIEKGIKIMWIVIAPVISIGFFLSFPFIVIFFQRDKFLYTDSVIVANMLKIYLFALIGMCLGTITSKIFYVLKDTKTLALMGLIEAIAYVVYTIYLTKWLGANGIVIGYVIYFSLSLAWHLAYIKFKLKTKFINHIDYFLKILFNAVIAGIFTYFFIFSFTNELLMIIIGGFIGVSIYVILTRLFLFEDIKILLT